MHITEDIAIDRSESEPKLYAKTLVAITPDDPDDGPGIPAGVIVEITTEKLPNHYHNESTLIAHYNGIHLDVNFSDLDPDC